MFSSNTSQTSGGYEIQRSLRFNSADSAYLNRTPASAGNRTTWTFSTWIKLSSVATEMHILGATGATLWLWPDSTLEYYDAGTAYRKTTQVFRDVSAWYHLVVVWDSGNATAADRIRFYLNGQQITSFSASPTVALNQLSSINSTSIFNLGRYHGGGYHFNGYMTEINFIDGQALTPSSFGAFDAQTGVWGPTPYAGSYGTNGFYLNFSDNSNTTAATLGKDYSGNGNNWTPNNFSVSAGAGNDSLVDVPTNWGTDTGVGGSVRGNYATLNPLDYSPYVALTNGNLDYTISSNQKGFRKATISASSGKWYAECLMTSSGNIVGIATADTDPMAGSGYVGATSTSWGYDGANGRVYNNASSSAYGSTYTTNDVIGIALDLDAGTLVFYKNGVSQGTAATGLSGTFTFATGQGGSGVTGTLNFGQRPFAYTAPSGFKALNTQTLPTPTIGATTATQAGKFFNPVLYTGNSTTNAITGVGFSPDFTWFKSRSDATNHAVNDSVRGINKILLPNTTNAEITGITYLNSIDSDGFTLANDSPAFNYTGYTYVAWNWKANGAGATNTAGSITSTVSANTTSGFSVVTYTGNGAAGPSVGHGLSAVPKMIILKQRTAQTNYNWFVYHQALGNTQYLLLNTTNPASSGVSAWNNTTPTSSVFTIGSYDEVNRSGSTFVAYCFAEVPGYSKFGSYTGNGSTDGPFVFCGFRPAFVMAKRTDGLGDWWIVDDTRSAYNQTANVLNPNSSDAEYAGTGFNSIDILANGFKVRTTNTSSNGSGATYIFMALAEAPQKFALAR